MDQDYPTILVVELGKSFSPTLLDSVRNAGYNILEALDWAEAVHFVRTHSRKIHALLATGNRVDPGVLELFKNYLPDMRVLLISDDPTESGPNAVKPNSLLAKLEEIRQARKRAAP